MCLGPTLLDTIALVLAVIHFTIPLAYYYYLRKHLGKPWDLTVDPGFQPRVTIIVPTFNEAGLIKGKLDNIYSQEYPRDRVEIIVVDSASTDGTLDKVREWAEEHRDVRLIIIEEPVRKGKAHALNTALKHASGDVIVVTDADSLWASSRTLSEAVKWFSDSTVGAISCIKEPTAPGVAGVEEGYRGYYNVLRVTESKAWATPVFHGELAAFRRDILEKAGGFPTDIGSDDSYTATKIALMGFRSIIPGDAKCVEAVPRKGYHLWKIRRAQHLIQHFTKTLGEKHGIPRQFKPILYTEAFLHLVNPWILLVATILLVASAVIGSTTATMLLAVGTTLLLYKPYRTWITTQLYLIVASIRNLWTKEITWDKNDKS